MAEPEHYTLGLVGRCLTLIDELYADVEKTAHKRHGGALTTTFLLTMAMPMIILPYERIYKADAAHRVADDKGLNPEVTNDIFADVSKKLKDTPFAVLDWRLVVNVAPFNIARGLGGSITDQLADESASSAALEASLESVWKVLRNGLAHGGVAYLDKDGKHSDRETAMVAFVSSQGKGEARRFSILRIPESDLFEFLFLWADWLRAEGLDQDLVA